MVFSGIWVFMVSFNRTLLGLNVGPFYAQNWVNGYQVEKVPRGTLGIDRN